MNKGLTVNWISDDDNWGSFYSTDKFSKDFVEDVYDLGEAMSKVIESYREYIELTSDLIKGLQGISGNMKVENEK